MGVETLSNEPTVITAGDTVIFEKDITAYEPLDSVSLKIIGESNISEEIEAVVADGVATFTIDSADTAEFESGTYKLIEWYVSGTERQTIYTGSLEVLANYADATAPIDTRSHAVKMLAAIKALLEGVATKEQKAITINNRSIEYLSPKELMEWKQFYEEEVRNEQAKQNVAAGKSSGRTIKAQFTEIS